MEKSLTDWIEYLDEMNSIFLPTVTFSTGDSDMHEFFISMEHNLKKVTFDDFSEFLDDPTYHYIYDRIKNNIKLHQEYILLTYFLSRRFRLNVPHKWALDLKILDYVYCDLGISFPYST